MIHVCYALYDKDGRYSKFTGTSMLSIFENVSARPPSVTVHILHDNTLTQENLDRFSNIAKTYKQRIKFYNVEKTCASEIENFKNLMPQIVDSKFTVATLYRLLVPNLFANVEKIIYLDSDIIVNLDIKKLWNVELGDKTLGAVAENDILPDHRKYVQFHYLMHAGFVKIEDYFNAGVLVLNLNAMRAEFEKLLDGFKFVVENPQCRWFDQDILNYCYAANYVHLPENFDVFVNVERRFGKSGNLRPAIYHYVGRDLQLDARDKLNKLWLQHFSKTPWFNADTISNINEGLRQMDVAQKNFFAQVSAALSERQRAFFVDSNNFDAIKKIFYCRGNEEFLRADSPDSIQNLINSMRNSRGQKIFFILKSYPAVQQILSRAGFVEGRDFINAALFLSEANGVPLDSYSIVKLL